jgi:hypothetical protein
MSHESGVIYSVPTHLQEREPFAFGRTVGEVARLVAIGFAATQLAASNDIPGALRFPAAAVVFLVGAVWALVRIQRRTLDGWLDLVVRYGTTPRRRVWRSGGANPVDRDVVHQDDARRGWYELERVRVRWTPETTAAALSSPSRGTGVTKGGGLS